MLPIKNLVKGLFSFVESGEFTFKPGILRDGDAQPIMDIGTLLPSETNMVDIQQQAKHLLDVASSGNIELLEALINARGGLTYTIFSYLSGAAIMVPCVNSAEEIPYAVMALARITDTGSGDSLANRVSKCFWCGKYFLRKTRKASKYHNHTCRVKASNRERLNSGWFRIYYTKRKEGACKKNMGEINA